MDLPKRPRQHRSEEKSLAILKYKLGDLGIFRDQGSNDYGIDCELELVRGDQVTGRIVKAQVKSSEGVTLRQDGTPSVSGIKQSTLAYWCEQSFNANVLAFLVDLQSEDIYVSRPIFPQATRLIDGGKKTKTIEFMPGGDEKTEILTLMLALAPKVPELVAAHASALRNLDKFLELLVGAYHYDAPLEIHHPEHFEELLEVSGTLLWSEVHDMWDDKRDKKHWTSYSYWKQKSEDEGFDGISFLASRRPLDVILPALIEKLHELQSQVMKARYYWAHNKPRHLALVYNYDIPSGKSAEELREIGYSRQPFRRGEGWTSESFVECSKERV